MDTSSTTFWLTKPLSLIGIDPAKVGNFILPFLGILMLPLTPTAHIPALRGLEQIELAALCTSR